MHFFPKYVQCVFLFFIFLFLFDEVIALTRCVTAKFLIPCVCWLVMWKWN